MDDKRFTTDRTFPTQSIDSWIFDLDNTLYPAESNLFEQIHDRMGAFIAQFLDVERSEAHRIQKDYYHRYGTTLSGLMIEHKMDPHIYLDYVHDIDHSVLSPVPELCTALEQLEGEKYIFTNGSKKHGEKVAEALGILEVFSGVFDIAAAGFTPKPHADAYALFLKQHNVRPQKAAMFEDLHPNLKVPHELGMTTVLVHSSYEDHPSQQERLNWTSAPDYIHFETDDLVALINEINTDK